METVYMRCSQLHQRIVMALINITRKEFMLMERTTIQQSVSLDHQKPTRTQIIVDHTFGEGDFMELFTDYIAGKIQANPIIEQKNTPEQTA